MRSIWPPPSCACSISASAGGLWPWATLAETCRHHAMGLLIYQWFFLAHRLLGYLGANGDELCRDIIYCRRSSIHHRQGRRKLKAGRAASNCDLPAWCGTLMKLMRPKKRRDWIGRHRLHTNRQWIPKLPSKDRSESQNQLQDYWTKVP